MKKAKIDKAKKCKEMMKKDIEKFYGRKVMDSTSYATVLAEWYPYYITDSSFREFLNNGKKLNYKTLKL